ncbi:hypothetical protein [Vibrio metschnikovii]|uniref:hypothetical protein n=1 Tax=Vibrio metschnikovii TaxID=28172 RepID=UPI001C30249C|nr:hypothetical protein [Vibrio metschnikovii]
MNPVTSGAPQTYSANGTASSVTPMTTDNTHDLSAKAEPNKVTLSEEGKALLAALQQFNDSEHQEQEPEAQPKSGTAKAFTYGALGMGHPDQTTEPTNKAYTAGKYLSAAAKIGGLVLLLA